jgi:Zn-dependent protease
MYLGLVVLLTFHEFGHAWMSHTCGDDTAKSQGRVSLNPIVHIDPIGTVLMPLLMIYLSLSGSVAANFLVGWARPVPVNPNNLRNPRVDEILVTLAGPWMNLLLAIVLMGLARVGLLVQTPSMATFCVNLAYVSLLLCFFNMIPIPPLDGSQIVRSLIGMSYEVYYQFARYGMIILILVLNFVPYVRETLGMVTLKSWLVIGNWFGVPMPVF